MVEPNLDISKLKDDMEF